MTAEQAIQEKFSTTASNVKQQIDTGIQRATDVGKEAWDGLGNVATPGSIFLPVSVLIIFFLLLLPVNGHTRIEWLWLTLTGNAHLTGASTGGSSDFNTGGVQGGSADFGNAAFVPPAPTFTGPSEVF